MEEQKNIKFELASLFVYNQFSKISNSNWETQDKSPRFMADVNGDSKADIVGFGTDGVYVSFSLGKDFTVPEKLLENFFTYGGSWISQDKYPRFLADVDGDGKADIVGFGTDAVYVSFSQGATFSQPEKEKLLGNGFCYGGSWISQNKYPRFLADVNGDGKADIVGFGEQGAFVSFAETTPPSGFQFKQPQLILTDFGASSGWETQDKYPRLMADVDGDKKADIIGLGKEGMRVKFSNGDSFGDEIFLPGQFVYQHWTRTTGDVNGDGKADVIGFDTFGFFITISNGRGFDPVYLANYNFGSSWPAIENDSWDDYNLKPRMFADVDGDGKADIVGFSPNGICVSFTKSISPMAVDLEGCGRYSPNLEVKCTEHLYKRALKRIEESKMTEIQKEQAKRELTSAYEDYWKLNSENNHVTNEDKRNKEVILTKVVKNTEESAQSAEVAAAQEAAAKEAEKEIKAAKKAKRMDDLDDLIGDPFKEEDDLYKTKDSNDQAEQTTITGDHQHYQNHDHFEL